VEISQREESSAEKGDTVENDPAYVVAAEDLPVPDELLRRLPPHLPWSWSSLLSPATFLGAPERI